MTYGFTAGSQYYHLVQIFFDTLYIARRICARARYSVVSAGVALAYGEYENKTQISEGGRAGL